MAPDPEIRRRASDPADYDPMEDRRFHGVGRDEVLAMIQKEAEVEGQGLKLGYKDLGLSMTGPNTIAMLAIIVLTVFAGGIGYINFRGFEQMSRDHTSQISATDRNTCLNSYLTDPARRDKLRDTPLNEWWKYCGWLRP